MLTLLWAKTAVAKKIPLKSKRHFKPVGNSGAILIMRTFSFNAGKTQAGFSDLNVNWTSGVILL